MGVYYLFRYLALKYPDCLINIKGDYNTAKIDLKVDWLELDMNALFHLVAGNLYYPIQKSLRHKKKTPPYNEKELFAAIGARIEQLRKITNPVKGIYLAVDGCSGLSKQKQQRSRRFKSASTVDSNWNSNNISVATTFMYNLSKYLEEFININLKINNDWKNLEIIYSSYMCPGEGEHKNLHHMSSNPSNTFVEVSPDADLIFLSMSITSNTNSKIYIFRENIYEDINADFFLVDVLKLQQSLLQELTLTKTISLTYRVNDFILFCFMLGNDFVPNIPTLYIPLNGIENIFNSYIKTTQNDKYITEEINNMYYINRPVFKEFLKNIPDDTSILNDYYTKHFGDIEIIDIVTEYLKGLTFVLNYYLKEIPSWEYYYPFHYAPLIKDIYKYIDDIDIYFTFDKGEPLSSLEQLLCILPSSSSYLLPKPLQAFSSSDNSIIIDMFPKTFEIDEEGKKNKYEGVVLLPNVDINRVRTAFNFIKHELTKEELERNKIGKEITYRN